MEVKRRITTFEEYKEEYSLATNIEVLVDLLQKEYQEEAPIN